MQFHCDNFTLFHSIYCHRHRRCRFHSVNFLVLWGTRYTWWTWRVDNRFQHTIHLTTWKLSKRFHSSKQKKRKRKYKRMEETKRNGEKKEHNNKKVLCICVCECVCMLVSSSLRNRIDTDLNWIYWVTVRERASLFSCRHESCWKSMNWQ